MSTVPRTRLDDALALARAGRAAAEADLFEELRIPSVSTLPEHRADAVVHQLMVVDFSAQVAASRDIGARPAPFVHHPADLVEIVADEPVEVVLQIPQLPLRPKVFQGLQDATHSHHFRRPVLRKCSQAKVLIVIPLDFLQTIAVKNVQCFSSINSCTRPRAGAFSPWA